jgi:hypothetical protein
MQLCSGADDSVSGGADVAARVPLPGLLCRGASSEKHLDAVGCRLESKFYAMVLMI